LVSSKRRNIWICKKHLTKGSRSCAIAHRDAPLRYAPHSLIVMVKKMKESGFDNYKGIWGNEYFEEDLKYVEDWNFKQEVFSNQPALVTKTDQGTELTPYTGQKYDKNKYELVSYIWDHEHCMVCRFTISEGFSYWVNPDNDILCDKCYNKYKK